MVTVVLQCWSSGKSFTGCDDNAIMRLLALSSRFIRFLKEKPAPRAWEGEADNDQEET
jgi:hypothetical protein